LVQLEEVSKLKEKRIIDEQQEKERLGICCQKEEQEKAEQQTYEHTIRSPKTGVCIIETMKHDRR